MGLTQSLFSIYPLKISGRDLILISGGLFLIHFSMAFSIIVEILNMRMRKKRQWIVDF